MWPDLWRALANRNPCNKCCKRVYIYIYTEESSGLYVLGPVTSRLIPGAGLYLINVTDTLARVNATARLFRSFICVPCLPSPYRIRATCESVHGFFFTYVRDASHACILEVYRIGLSIGAKLLKKRKVNDDREKNVHANYSFILRSETERTRIKRISRKSSYATRYTQGSINAYFVYDTKARNSPLISRQVGAAPRAAIIVLVRGRLNDNATFTILLFLILAPERGMERASAAKVGIRNGIPHSVPADFGR